MSSKPGPKSGFTLVELMIVVAVIAIISSFAISALVNSRKAANETSAIASLSLICSAQERYEVWFGQFATVSDLVDTGLLDESFADGAGPRGGYLFRDVVAPSVGLYQITAEPVDSSAGDRFFYVNSSGVIRFSTTGTANASSLPIE